MEYYSAIKKNEIMIFARKWMELKIIRLSEIRVILKKVNTTCFLLFMESRSKKKKKGHEHKWIIIGSWEPLGGKRRKKGKNV
jgi:hypothetical protein